MESPKPAPALPREAAKTLLRYLITQNSLQKIAEGDNDKVRSAPWREATELLGTHPSLDDIVSLFVVLLKTIGEHAGRYNQYEIERIGRAIQYWMEEISKQMTVTINHPEAFVDWNVTGERKDAIKLTIPAQTEQITGMALMNKFLPVMVEKIEQIAPETTPRYRAELQSRFNQILRK